MNIIQSIRTTITQWQAVHHAIVPIALRGDTRCGTATLAKGDPLLRDLATTLWITTINRASVTLELRVYHRSRVQLRFFEGSTLLAVLTSLPGIKCLKQSKRTLPPRRRLSVLLVSQSAALHAQVADLLSSHRCDLTLMGTGAYQHCRDFSEWEHIFIDTGATSDYLLGTNVSLLAWNPQFQSINHQHRFDVLSDLFTELDLWQRIENSYAKRRKRILLAEDSNASRAMMGHVLKRLGCDVVEVNNGAEALRQARTSDFDLMVIDENMPQLQGSEVIREANRTSNRINGTPIVAVTGLRDAADLQDIYAVGISTLLQKPISPQVFSEHVSHWLHGDAEMR